MMLDEWAHSGSAPDDVPKLGGNEASKHGHDAVVSCHRMEAEREACEPEPGCRDATAPQVRDDDPAAGDSIELANDLRKVVVGEVMQELRTHHDVDAVVAKGKLDGVSRDNCADAVARGAKQVAGLIQADTENLRAAIPTEGADRAGNVGQAGP